MNEIELKFRLAGAADHERLRERLAALGGSRDRREHEENRMYADEAGALAAAGKVLRLRILDGGPAGKLTFKDPATYDGNVKVRREVEVGVDDAGAAHALLESLGYRTYLTYEKQRETWHAGEVEVALDELAFGHFCEIEGPADTIRALAAQLGLDDAQAEQSGYPSLMTAWLRKAESGARRPE